MTTTLLATTPPLQTFSHKQVAAFFFKPELDSEGELTGYQTCKSCGKWRKHAPKNGYTNLVTHVRSAHLSFEMEMRDASAAATGTLVPWVSQKASDRYAWIKWVVEGNLPLSFCESKETRRYTNLAPVSVGTLVSNMEDVTKAVERSIGLDMPTEFGLMFDGWSHGTEHYLAVYACYDGPSGPCYPLLSMAPIMDEPDDQLGAEGHLIAIERFLPFFGKTIEGCKFIVGDNCSVNKRLANMMGVPLVGCASHRLQLAVRDYLTPHEDALEEIQILMRKPRTLKQAAKLRTKTPLMPVLRQATRWSSTFAMLKPDDEEISDLLPSRMTHRKLDGVLSELRCVKSVSKMLQSEGLTLLDARDLFDGLLEARPSMARYLIQVAFNTYLQMSNQNVCVHYTLAPNADIVHSPEFEAAVVKVLAGKQETLVDDEAVILEPFLQREVPPNASAESPSEEEGFAEHILKRRRISSEPPTYKLLRSIPPTSNAVERLFSIARAVLRLERHRLSPMTLEMILFLRINSAYWNVATVDSCV
ncbi:hypothetical protein PPTG_13659 [Phytophthora nicotianae INRA-310]|uniref:BED-type domain-containing protein n=1 Tax=Phytophthora nicotianae (strain INRA-310) TaxID=761204 RepID=W2PZM8_PHYN3|nr:hypothetical protein PPTG_13659 [Phytophthora nicotianae INRA-310]ETN06302.1 hypothetical protein PPTG_13659 [Phytophthora nicotianae INRA-310]